MGLVGGFALSAPANGETSPALAGQVRYYADGSGVAGVAVDLSGPAQAAATTDASGAYVFDDPGAGSWQLAPRKFGELNAAVSALDAVYALQAVVGLRTFTDAQRLACDVTGDGTVSAFDAARILQFVIGLLARFPVAENCGSDWIFVPDPAAASNQHLVGPQMAPVCAPGAILFEPLAPPAMGQDFLAIALGDCTGNWRPAAPPPSSPAATVAPPSATPTPDPPSATPTATASATRSPTTSATVPPSATATNSPTGSRTGTATRTGTPTQTATFTATATWTPVSTPTSSSTRTLTATATETLTPSVTPTWTVTHTVTSTITRTPTRTHTPSPIPTSTVSATPTRTGTRTRTPTMTATVSPTPTATCANGVAWNVSAPRLVSQQTGGEIWLTRTVATDFGWGVFWLRVDPGETNRAHLYYAHVDFSGQLTVAPMLVTAIPRIAFRAHYYMVAWNEGHYGLLTAEYASLYYQNMTLDGVLSGRHVVGPPLFVDPQYDQESDGDLDAYPGGFLGVVEGECSGHSCSYAFKLNANGGAIGGPINLVDFDLTHQFYPVSAFDGVGFAILSVKDITIPNGGVMTRYWPLSGSMSGHKKVVPAKEYQWDEFADVAWNGRHFAAIWTENSARSHASPWQIHFATFQRSSSASTLIANRVIDAVQQKTNHRWTTQVQPMGGDWVAQYASRAPNGAVIAVFELLGADAQRNLAIEPFELNADALGSSPHFATQQAGVLGIARGSYDSSGTAVEFYTLAPPACP